MNGFLLDTHIWLWAQRNDTEQLSNASLSLIEDWQRRGIACVSPFSAWEISLLAMAGKVTVGSSVQQFVEQGTRDDGFSMLPLTSRILIESTHLPGNLHRDPADRILVATARELGLTLATRDKKLLDYARHGHLNVREL